MATKLPEPIPMSPAMAESFKLLKDFAEGDIVKVQEVLFVQRVLPTLADTSGTPVDLSIWVEITGSIQRPMDVVDENDKVLFRVPSPFSSYPTSTRREAFHGVGHIVADAKAHGEIHPAIGERILRTGLGKVLPSPHVDIQKARAWNAILLRYGYPGVHGLAELEQAQKGQDTKAALFDDAGDDL